MFFLMSVCFNKTKPEDFGLVITNINNVFLNPTDDTKWLSRELFDLGWGKEKGFCKLPMLNFEDLIKIANLDLKNSKDIKPNYDMYGSIAVLLEDYPIKLLLEIERIIKEKGFLHKDFIKLLRSQMPLNDDVLNKFGVIDKKDYYKRWNIIFEELGKD